MKNQLTRIMSVLFCTFMIASNACAMETLTDQEILGIWINTQTHIDFSTYPFDDQKICNLAAKIKETNKVTCVVLSSTQCGDAGFKALIDAPSITHLTVRQNNISSEGVQYLCNRVSSNSSLLKYVDLTGNPIGDDGRRALAALLKAKPSFIALFSWDISSDIIKNALKGNPAC